MALPSVLEHRRHSRRRIVGFMPGRLFTADRREEFYYRPLDVSPYGLGLFAEDKLDEIGSDFVLVLAEHEIELQLVWSTESPGDRFGYRHGFKVKDPNLDLEQLCREYGYL